MLVNMMKSLFFFVAISLFFICNIFVTALACKNKTLRNSKLVEQLPASENDTRPTFS